MSAKSGDFSTSSYHGSISDEIDTSLLLSRVSSEVERLIEDLTSPPIPREVMFHPESSSQYDRNFKVETEFSMDAEIEQENALNHLPREKSIRNSIHINNDLVFIIFDLETGRENVE